MNLKEIRLKYWIYKDKKKLKALVNIAEECSL